MSNLSDEEEPFEIDSARLDPPETPERQSSAASSRSVTPKASTPWKERTVSTKKGRHNHQAATPSTILKGLHDMQTRNAGISVQA